MTAPGAVLRVELERELPASVPCGTATAVVCLGTCWVAGQRLAALELLVDGRAAPVSAFGMPRPELHDGPPERRRGGFWATATTPGAQDGAVELALRARLDDGTVTEAALGAIAVAPRAAPPSTGAAPKRTDSETIAVCMATFEPDMGLLETQLRSLREQTDEGWICLIHDDCSSPERYAEIRELVDDDPRFAVARAPRRLGFYRNFEAALEMVPPTAGLVALCDQDDRWHPDKLAALRAGLGDAILVYSDQRLVDASGVVLRDTMWRGRANNHSDLTSLLVANSITGAAMMFGRELLGLALPFPDTPGFQFHDTWLAVIALAAGDVAYVERPLYDYVQHPGAVFGDVTHGAPNPRGRRGRLAKSLERPREGVRASAPPAWRAAYFHGYLGRRTQAQAALARCGSRLTAGKRRALERFVALDHSLASTAWLAARGARGLVGDTPTLGTELVLARGLAWKQAATAAARHRHLSAGLLADASVPPPQRYTEARMRRWRATL